MAFLQKIIDQVSMEARQKGVRCRGTGKIEFIEHDNRWIEALVTCGGQFLVTLSYEPGAVEFACKCNTYVRDLESCEHVWATLLAAEQLGYLAGWEGRGWIDFGPMDDQAPAAYVESEDEDEPEKNFDINDNPFVNVAHFLTSKAPKPAPKVQDWKSHLESLRQSLHSRESATPWPGHRQLLYVIDVPNARQGGGLLIELMGQDRRKDGTWGKAKFESLGSGDAARMPDRGDAELLAMLGGAERDAYGYFNSSSRDRSSRYRIPEVQYSTIVRRACETGRCRLRMETHGEELVPIAWDDSVWEFWLIGNRDEQSEQFVLTGELRAGERRMKLSEPVAMLTGGLLFTSTHAARLDHNNTFQWIALLRRQKQLAVPMAAGEELLTQLLTMPELPRLELPKELTVQQVSVTPKPRLRVKKPAARPGWSTAKPKLIGELSFDYDGQIVGAHDEGPGIYQSSLRRMILRDPQAERTAGERLRALGFRDQRPSYYRDENEVGLELAPSHLPVVIRALLAENWYVEADGALYRQPGEFKMEVSSGIDWFELHGNVDFDGQTIALPELLRALRRGDKMIRLDDGTFGVLPEQWLQKYGLLAGMGEEKKDHVRFAKTQVGLLDALLLSQPEVSCDTVFEQARQRLRDFAGVRIAEPPDSFVGTLRPYQREGLGWLEFLRQFGFGGCLADDMGLGKTVQVLALLEERRLMRLAPAPAGTAEEGRSGQQEKKTKEGGEGQTGGGNGEAMPEAVGAPPHAGTAGDGSVLPERPAGPSLVVAPRSLVFNWSEEAGRFAPNIRVLDHTGIGRARDAKAFADYDLILTTYGTLRNDITFFKDFRFDYVVLDEAQAVKNSASESAKSARLLAGSHRLALSGTPVQNHLGELWSLFEFLNPGMLGAARAFQATGAGTRNIDEGGRMLLSRALRPFILRRTKAQVAKELPQRLEQTIHCELDVAQRKQYNDLKEHYRQSLLSKVAAEGIAKNKIQVLEALLRLRQAACHPGLIDKSKVDQSSAKLDSLLAQLAEVTDGGHKALVFSQFTSMLAIVRSRLDKEKIKYAYLDGRTRDRQEVVAQFQTDEKTQLFLISLKAGGVGLNLTAAEYVFLLDPWWNPAVEAQAIDRAHRIGQTRQVFAYRLIAKDTVEEKVLQLQNTKRELADAIINADNSLIGKLGREDLEMLLS